MPITPPSPVRWRTLLVTFLTTSGLLATLWRFLEPIYFTLDDVTIRLAIAGEDLPGEPPTSHLETTHEALARVAVELQRALPGLPVWDLVLAATLAAGIAGLCAFAWNAPTATIWRRSAVLATMIVAVLPFIGGLTFTISAVVCAGAAVLVMVTELLWSETPRRSMLTAAAAALLAGYTVRPMGAEAATLVTIACLIPVAIARAPRRRRLLRLGAVAMVVTASFAALDYADVALYGARDGWADYHDYHWRLVGLLDWHRGDTQLAAIRAAAGWSPNDFDLLQKGWGTADWTLFGSGPVTRASLVFAAATARSPIARARAALAASDMRANADLLRGLIAPSFATQDSLTGLPSLVALTLALAAGFGNRRALLLTCLLLIEFSTVCIALQIGFKTLPFRLLAPLEACFVAVVIAVAAEHPQVARSWGAAIAIVVTAFLLVLQAWVVVQQGIAETNYARKIERQVAEAPALSQSLLVLHSDEFPAEHWWRPFRRPPVRFAMIRLGGNNGNPLLQHYLRVSGRPHLLLSICSEPSVVVVASRGRLDAVTRYMAEHAGRAVTWEPVFEGAFQAWRCR